MDVTAKFVLTDGADGSTGVAWTADVRVSGLLAGVGVAQTEATAGRMVGEVLDCARAKLEA